MTLHTCRGEHHNRSETKARQRKVYQLTHVPAALPSLSDHCGSSLTVGSGQTQTFTATFTPPADIDQTTFPVYSGFIQLTDEEEQLHVAYLGLAATLYDKKVMDDTDFLGLQFPLLVKDSDEIDVPTNFTFDNATSDFPQAYQSERVAVFVYQGMIATADVTAMVLRSSAAPVMSMKQVQGLVEGAAILFITQDSMFDALGARELAKLKGLSKSIRNMQLRYESVVFGLSRLYGPFFDNDSIRDFRILQIKTGALVSGSCVVQLLSRRPFAPSDLDVFVGKDYVLAVGEFLEKAGYTFHPLKTLQEGKVKITEEQHAHFEAAVQAEFDKPTPNTGTVADRYEFTTLAGVFNFFNPSGKKVQIVAVNHEPIEAILGFYSTVVMNIATATEIISLYPMTTFVEGRALFVKQYSRTVEVARTKYEARGWSTFEMLSASDYLRTEHELSLKTRWIGDGHCWVIKLPPVEGYAGADHVYRVLKVTSWYMFCPGPSSVRMSVHRLKGSSLRSTYMVTWHVQDFVWRHPCFEGSQDPLDMESLGVSEARAGVYEGEVDFPGEAGSDSEVGDVLNTVLELGDGARPGDEASNEEDSVLQESSSSGSVDSMSSAHWELWKYRLGYGVCIHEQYRPPFALDACVVEYLEGLYPLMERDHDTKRDVVYMKNAFGSLADRYSFEADCYPSGHVVTMIHQCLEDVDLTCVCDDPEVSLQFLLDEDSSRVLTVCTILVEMDLLGAVQDELRGWTYSEDEMAVSGLIVLLGGMA
ncbi:hypothetical protein VNI00_018064 [Paramarasmius palmivorus]|uniref:C5a peptidase/Subtilisin-like protease SBT2-like Fn3-like domain-containing protein n=1 Tax=Paramarasmius palmivorus TaxID=297713 RepID=A0AAW0B3N1_9AGAR